jgi:hypothetical protein
MQKTTQVLKCIGAINFEEVVLGQYVGINGQNNDGESKPGDMKIIA